MKHLPTVFTTHPPVQQRLLLNLTVWGLAPVQHQKSPAACGRLVTLRAYQGRSPGPLLNGSNSTCQLRLLPSETPPGISDLRVNSLPWRITATKPGKLLSMRINAGGVGLRGWRGWGVQQWGPEPLQPLQVGSGQATCSPRCNNVNMEGATNSLQLA